MRGLCEVVIAVAHHPPTAESPLTPSPITNSLWLGFGAGCGACLTLSRLGPAVRLRSGWYADGEFVVSVGLFVFKRCLFDERLIVL